MGSKTREMEEAFSNRPCCDELLRFQHIFEHTLEPIVFHKWGIISDFNPAALHLIGGENREDFLSRSVFDFIHPKDHKPVEDRIQQMYRTGEPAGPAEIRLKRVDGAIIYVELLSVPLTLRGERVVQVTLRDVTERRKAQIAYERSEYFWRTLIEHAADGIFVVQLDGRVVEVNSRACEMTGQTRSELLELNLNQLFADHYDGDERALWRAIRKGETARFERWIKGPRGSTLPVEVHLGLVDDTIVEIIVRDISERKKAQNELFALETRWRALVDYYPEPILITEGEKILFMNRAGLTVAGFESADDAKGRSLEDVVPEYMHSVLDARITRGARGEILPPTTYPIHTPDGEVRHFEVTSTPVVYEGRAAVQTIARDITRQKQVEEALIKSERLLRAIVTNLPVVVCAIDPSGVVTMIEGKGLENLPVRAPELIGHSIFAICKEFPAIVDAFQQAAAGQPAHTTVEFTSSCFELWLAPVTTPESGEHAGVIILAMDITERMKAVEAQKNSEVFLDSVVENLPIQLYVKDAADLRYVRCNRVYEEVMGKDRSELIGKSDHELFPPEIAETFIAQDRMVLETGAMIMYTDETMQTPNFGERIYRSRKLPITDASGKPRYVLGISEDVTDEKHAQQALLDSEQRYRAIMENAGDAVIIAESGTGRLIDANRQTSDLTGYTHDELLSMTLTDLYTPGSIDATELHFNGSQDVETTHRYRRHVRHKAGHDIPIDVSSSHLTIKGNTYMLGILRDMTMQRQYEAGLVEAKERAEELSRLKTAFLANMSHEIRTPLTSIIGFADVLAEEIPAEHREFAHLIQAGGRRLLDTLNSVLDLAQLESRSLKLNPEIIHVNDHLRDVVRLFEPRAAARGLYLKLDLPDRSPLAVLDRAAFDRIMNNLHSNALKFTLEGGVTISAKIDDESVIVEVTDTGVGISESFLPFVFDEFKQES